MAPALLKKSSLVSLRKGRFSFRLLGQMTYNGSSEGLSELSAGITVFLFNWVMMKNWGEVGVAAFTAINYMLNLGVQMFVGLSDGIVPILSFEAMTESEAICLSKEELHRHFNSSIAMANLGRRMLERYLTLLDEYPEVIQQIPMKYIASYLGVTVQSLSRIRASLNEMK